MTDNQEEGMAGSPPGAVVPIDVGWSDAESWDALHQATSKDRNGNAMEGPVVAVDCRNSYLRCEGLTIAALGLKGLAIGVSDDAILVYLRYRAQDLGKLVDQIADDPRYASLVRREPDNDQC